MDAAPRPAPSGFLRTPRNRQPFAQFQRCGPPTLHQNKARTVSPTATDGSMRPYAKGRITLYGGQVEIEFIAPSPRTYGFAATAGSPRAGSRGGRGRQFSLALSAGRPARCVFCKGLGSAGSANAGMAAPAAKDSRVTAKTMASMESSPLFGWVPAAADSACRAAAIASRWRRDVA